MNNSKYRHHEGNVEEVEIEGNCEHLYQVRDQGSWSKQARFDLGFYDVKSDAIQAALIYMQLKRNNAKAALLEVEANIQTLNNRLTESN